MAVEEMIEKALDREIAAMKAKGLTDKRKAYDDEIRLFVEENQTGKDDQGNPLWEKENKVRIKLTPNRRYYYPTKLFIEKLAEKRKDPIEALREATKYLNTKKKTIEAGVEAPNGLPITKEELDEMRRVREFDPIVQIDILLPLKELLEKIRVEESSSYYDQILNLLKENPNGLKLTEMGEELNVAWQQLIPSANLLLKQERVTKEKKVYYPQE